MATFSVVSGVTKGLKWLSNINMVLAAALALFVLILGPTLFLMQSWVQNLGGYVQALPELMLRTSPFAEDGWAGRLDHLLLGLVDELGTVRRHVHRAHLTRPHHPRIRLRCAAGPDARRFAVVHDLR